MREYFISFSKSNNLKNYAFLVCLISYFLIKSIYEKEK